jgi:copper homeostasis protein CutC
VKEHPAEALQDFRLTDEERSALLNGDVAKLHALGAHGFVLGRMPRHGVFGLTQELYIQRMKGGASV